MFLVGSRRSLLPSFTRHLLVAGIETLEVVADGMGPGRAAADAVIAVGPASLTRGASLAMARDLPLLSLPDTRETLLSRGDFERAVVEQVPVTRIELRGRTLYAIDVVLARPGGTNGRVTLEGPGSRSDLSDAMGAGFELCHRDERWTSQGDADEVPPVRMPHDVVITMTIGDGSLHLDGYEQHVPADTTVVFRPYDQTVQTVRLTQL